MTDKLKTPLIIFDLGNILFELDGVEGFWPEDSRNTELCQTRWNSSKVVYQLETGRISDFNIFYREISAELGIKLGPAEFEEVFLGIIGKPFAGTENMLAKLASEYRLMILSNTNEPHWKYCLSMLPLEKYIERSFLSHEMGSMKPEERIYEEVLYDLKTDPQNIYYFDDKEENIVSAQKYGIRAYKSWGGDKLRSDLKQLSLLR